MRRKLCQKLTNRRQCKQTKQRLPIVRRRLQPSKARHDSRLQLNLPWRVSRLLKKKSQCGSRKQLRLKPSGLLIYRNFNRSTMRGSMLWRKNSGRNMLSNWLQQEKLLPPRCRLKKKLRRLRILLPNLYSPIRIKLRLNCLQPSRLELKSSRWLHKEPFYRPEKIKPRKRRDSRLLSLRRQPPSRPSWRLRSARWWSLKLRRLRRRIRS